MWRDEVPHSVPKNQTHLQGQKMLNGPWGESMF